MGNDTAPRGPPTSETSMSGMATVPRIGVRRS